SMHTHPLSEYMEYIYKDQWEGVAELMLSSARKLAAAGADFLICPDNTIHQVFDLMRPKSLLPWLHIAEEVAREAQRNNFKHLAVLGTRYLMEGPVYPSRLAPANIKHTIPDAATREQINTIIFDELVNAQFTAKSRAYFSRVIERLKGQGCDAVVLGCTEIPLIVSPEDSVLPTLDSTRLLARAAIAASLR